MSARRRVLALSACLLALADAATFGVMRRTGGAVLLVPVDDFSLVAPPVQVSRELDAFVAPLRGTPEQALTNTMNAVHSVELFYSSNDASLVDHLRRGGGLSCTGMARLYAATLASSGVPARVVAVGSSVFEQTLAHESVEVTMDGRWVLMDPTFHAMFLDDRGRALSAVEVSDRLREGREVQPRFLGPVAYPSRLELYRFPWRAMFAEVSVTEAGSAGAWARIPPFRYFRGPKRYVRTDSAGGRMATVHNAWYFAVCAGGPATSLALLALSIRRRSARSARTTNDELATADAN